MTMTEIKTLTMDDVKVTPLAPIEDAGFNCSDSDPCDPSHECCDCDPSDPCY
jgi:hypothetical protein